MSEQEFEIKKLNLLAFPRNQHPKCELTDAPATVQLVTQYCSLVTLFIILPNNLIILKFKVLCQ